MVRVARKKCIVNSFLSHRIFPAATFTSARRAIHDLNSLRKPPVIALDIIITKVERFGTFGANPIMDYRRAETQAEAYHCHLSI